MLHLRAIAAAAAVMVIAVAGCTNGRKTLDYGRADCAYCRMRIDDSRFGGEIISAHGKRTQFDAIECLASYYAALPDRSVAQTVLVADFEHPGRLIPLGRARFVRVTGSRTGSPMGRGMLAVSAGADVRRLAELLGGGTELSWLEVVAHAGVDTGAESAVTARAVSTPAATARRTVVDVIPRGPVHSIGDALLVVNRGGTIIVHAGVYRDSTINVSIPVTIIGQGWPVLDGEHNRQIMTVTADSVTVRGIHFRNVGVAFTEDLAAIKIVKASDCVISGNDIDDAFFGIYLQEARRCVVDHNTLRATSQRDATSGNGIHLWNSRDVTITGNRISGHRDGIYFEFVRAAHLRDNVSEGNLRYGLHFMYSDSCDYQTNVFRRNGAGVAVMYSHVVAMTGNRFEDNSGSASYGLLLKEIADAHLERNVFARNTTALFADGATRLVARHNDFLSNGWAVRLSASADAALFTGNNFAGNTFDLATNSHSNTATFTGNYWSAYDGYDLNHDGAGDVAFRPVRLSSIVVARNEPALILLRSTFLALLDAAERIIPALTPGGLVDAAPSMRWVR
ncbi:MAG TPA: nitrous oxide reductase family maturation protein NosD [Gemmatimonadaceae bacterium]|nr:nitrous oxide reductase family maturation protein NosD [Gemmatimonadaceae bacterium]